MNLDSRSEWYLSALTSVIVESVTLPARSRWYEGFESWLLDNSSPQKLFALKGSIRAENSRIDFVNRSNRGDSKKDVSQENHDDAEQFKRQFDLDLSPIGSSTQKDTHIFHQIQVLRDSRSDQSQAIQAEAGQGLTAQRLSLAGDVSSILR